MTVKPLAGQFLRKQQGRRAGVDEQRIAWLEKPDGTPRDRAFGFCILQEPSGKEAFDVRLERPGLNKSGPAVKFPDEAALGEVRQVAADSFFEVPSTLAKASTVMRSRSRTICTIRSRRARGRLASVDWSFYLTIQSVWRKYIRHNARMGKNLRLYAQPGVSHGPRRRHQGSALYGLCARIVATHGRVLEFRDFLLDHLHSGRRHHLLSLGMGTGGGFQATIGWIVGGLFALVVATSLGQIASAYPTAGGLYHWASILGGRGWGWATAWINLLGLIFVVASVNVGVWQLFRDLVVSGVFHIDVTAWTVLPTDPLPAGITADQVAANNSHAIWVQIAAVSLIAITQALFNHFGIKTTTTLTDFSGYLIFVVAVVLTAAFLIWGASLGFLPYHNVCEQHR